MTRMIPDPTDDTKWIIGSAAEESLGFQVGASTLANVHPESACAGRHCVVHNPSDHHMRDWSLNWRGDTRVMERMCPHGVGHPDPDDIAYHQKVAGKKEVWQAIHGCDGCCSQREEDAK